VQRKKFFCFRCPESPPFSVLYNEKRTKKGVIFLKRILLTIVLVSMMANSMMVSAAIRTTIITPTLTFTGTTAYCRVSITEIGKDIEATLELWQENTLIDSWLGSATSYLVIAGNHGVISGQTYTLKVAGTIDGVAFTGTPVIKTC